MRFLIRHPFVIIRLTNWYAVCHKLIYFIFILEHCAQCTTDSKYQILDFKRFQAISNNFKRFQVILSIFKRFQCDFNAISCDFMRFQSNSLVEYIDVRNRFVSSIQIVFSLEFLELITTTYLFYSNHFIEIARETVSCFN